MIAYTTEQGRNGNAKLVSSSSYELTNTIENDVYTFNVTVTNSVGSTSALSERIAGIVYSLDKYIYNFEF